MEINMFYVNFLFISTFSFSSLPLTALISLYRCVNSVSHLFR
jgi:hypothetical protein